MSRQEIMQEAENAIVEQTMDTLATINVTPLQRVDVAGNLARGLIDALAPIIDKALAYKAEATTAGLAVARKPRAPRKPKAVQVPQPVAAQPAPPFIPKAPAPDVTQPAKYSGPPAAAQPFAG